jgi:CubicO group peptidase (beta-lactamase class C family)
MRLIPLLLFALGCSGQSDDAATESTDWVVEDPADHGLDPEALEAVRSWLFEAERQTQGVVIVRHGVIVAEWYADGRDAESPGTSWSVAKSVTSALVGIAIDEGHIAGVDLPMHTWFDGWAGDDHADITLEDVLMMGSGLQWSEDYEPIDMADSDIIQMILLEEDQLNYAAGRPVEVAPGTRFNYSSGDTMLLGGVLAAATGETVGDYAASRLFEPIGMGVEWWRDAVGNTVTYCCVDTPSRSFARLGELFLNDGNWHGEQVVPTDWVATSTTKLPTACGECFLSCARPSLEGREMV